MRGPRAALLAICTLLYSCGALLYSCGAVLAAKPVGDPALGDPALGEYLSSLCVTCHLPSGKAAGAIPPIVGWPEDQFVAVLNSYRWKERENAVMQTVTAQLTDEEIAALAAYFGRLPKRGEIKQD